MQTAGTVRKEFDTRDYECASCGFKLWLPIAPLSVSHLGLYDDGRYPGRSILVLNEHYEDLVDLPVGLMADFVADVQKAGRAIKNAVHAVRMNYAVLGNVAPHVHFHLIPRQVEGDPAPKRAPWATDVQHVSLALKQRRAIALAIQSSLEVQHDP